jgi:hypothetical protein
MIVLKVPFPKSGGPTKVRRGHTQLYDTPHPMWTKHQSYADLWESPKGKSAKSSKAGSVRGHGTDAQVGLVAEGGY